MMRLNILKAVAALCLTGLPPSHGQAADIEKIVSQTIRPMMQQHAIPGMAVAIVADGKRTIYEFGVMSKATGKPVTRDTLFEIGSVSKTFTVTLASVAEVGGHLSLSDPASRHLSALRGSSFDKVSLLDLATHTSGGLPLQFPGSVTNDEQMMRYFREWKPTHTPGTVRTYANPSVGLLGLIAARSLNDGFDALMERRVIQPLGLKRTYLQVPKTAMPDYAQGYTRQDAPARMMPGLRASEAYGVKTTAGDLLRFIEAQMGLVPVDPDLQRAILATHTGYYRVGRMTQDLIWEQYAYPVDLKDLLLGNSSTMSLGANPVERIDPPSRPRDDVWINKTGSTNGFGSYVAFVPVRKIGIVLLANKNYPNEARVTAAHAIVTQLTGKP